MIAAMMVEQGYFQLAAVSMAQGVFMGVFVGLLLGIALLPRRFIGQEGGAPPWWRNVRVWAMAICGVQIVVYWIWG